MAQEAGLSHGSAWKERRSGVDVLHRGVHANSCVTGLCHADVAGRDAIGGGGVLV